MGATAMEAGARWRRGCDGGTRDGSSSVVFLALPRCPPWLNDLLVGVDRVVGLSAGKASGSGEKQAAGSAPSHAAGGTSAGAEPANGAGAGPRVESRTGALVHRILRGEGADTGGAVSEFKAGEGATVQYVNVSQNTSHTLRAKRVIYALPQFTVRHILL